MRHFADGAYCDSVWSKIAFIVVVVVRPGRWHRHHDMTKPALDTIKICDKFISIQNNTFCPARYIPRFKVEHLLIFQRHK